MASASQNGQRGTARKSNSSNASPTHSGASSSETRLEETAWNRAVIWTLIGCQQFASPSCPAPRRYPPAEKFPPKQSAAPGSLVHHRDVPKLSLESQDFKQRASTQSEVKQLDRSASTQSEIKQLDRSGVRSRSPRLLPGLAEQNAVDKANDDDPAASCSSNGSTASAKRPAPHGSRPKSIATRPKASHRRTVSPCENLRLVTSNNDSNTTEKQVAEMEHDKEPQVTSDAATGQQAVEMEQDRVSAKFTQAISNATARIDLNEAPVATLLPPASPKAGHGPLDPRLPKPAAKQAVEIEHDKVQVTSNATTRKQPTEVEQDKVPMTLPVTSHTAGKQEAEMQQNKVAQIGEVARPSSEPSSAVLGCTDDGMEDSRYHRVIADSKHVLADCKHVIAASRHADPERRTEFTANQCGLVLVDICFQQFTKKAKHRASTTLGEMVALYKDRLSPKVGASNIRVCSENGIELGADIILTDLKSSSSNQPIRIMFEEDDWFE